MIKNKYLFLIIFLLIVLVIDYSFFYKKIFTYNNNLNNNYNFIVLTGGDNRVTKSLKIFFQIENKNKNLFISGVGKGFNKKTLKYLKQNKYMDVTNFINFLLSKKLKVNAFALHEDWNDIGLKENLKKLK